MSEGSPPSPVVSSDSESEGGESSLNAPTLRLGDVGSPSGDESPAPLADAAAEDDDAMDDAMGSSDSEELDDPESDGESNMFQDSQLGSWWGSAYQEFGERERLENTQVPIEALYEMFVDRKPSKEYQGTFSKSDLRRFGFLYSGKFSCVSVVLGFVVIGLRYHVGVTALEAPYV